MAAPAPLLALIVPALVTLFVPLIVASAWLFTVVLLLDSTPGPVEALIAPALSRLLLFLTKRTPCVAPLIVQPVRLATVPPFCSQAPADDRTIDRVGGGTTRLQLHADAARGSQRAGIGQGPRLVLAVDCVSRAHDRRGAEIDGGEVGR
jgi:hypothetical protein